jgi:hypothetical protein
MKGLTTIILLLKTCASLGKEGGIEVGRRSKPIVKVDRHLGSKSSKTSKRDDKAGKYSNNSQQTAKSSHSAKSSKSSHQAYDPQPARVSRNSNDSRTIDIRLAEMDTEMDFGAKEVVVAKNLLNDGIAMDYTGAAYIGTFATLVLFWN